jgi:hypothetical protein
LKLFGRTVTLSAAKRGFFEKMQSKLPSSERADWSRFSFESYCERFDNYYNNYPKIKSSVLTIAGQGTSEGLFVIADEYDQANKAAQVCEKFNNRVNMVQMLYETFIRMVKYGTAFWEIDWNSVNGVDVQLIPHQEHMTPIYNDVDGSVKEWHYNVHATTLATYKPEQLLVFAWNIGENQPFGTSLLTGLDREVATTDEIVKNLKAYLEKQAFASNLVQIGDSTMTPQATEIQDITVKIRNRNVGEDFVTSYPIENKLLAAAQIETRMIPDTLQFMDDQITDALMAPPISKLYNSTEASALVMTEWCRSCLIKPMQRIAKQIIERQIYQPLLEDLGYSVRVVPKLIFENPEVNSSQPEIASFWGTLIDKQVITPKQVADKLGIEYDAAYWAKKEAQDMAMQQAKLDASAQPADEKPAVKESWLVQRIKEPKHD